MAWPLYAALFFTSLCIMVSRRRRTRLPYPPGPPAEPIIGHMRVMPLANQDTIYREWSKTYGDVMYFHVPGNSYLVLNSLRAANELLEKRSGIYSDRMRLILYEMMGWYPTLTFLTYGKRFQKHRKLMQEYLHQKRCMSYEPLQTQETRRLLMRLVDNSSTQNWVKDFQRFSTAIIVKIAYGRDITSNDDPYISIAFEAFESLLQCGSPGGTMIDILPFLRFFPSWFPGTYYAYKARSLSPAVHRFHEYPFEVVKSQVAEGTAQPSYLSYYLEQLHGDYSDKDYMDDLKGSAAVMFAGGAETTQSALSFFVLAMVLFPEFQKRAQREIDEVIGRNRLPELRDRDFLPYVEAIVQETLRWNTVIPSGIPHRSIDDDVYNGMFIPKGTIIIPNSFAILRDESVYFNPDSYNPDRYLPEPMGKGEPYPIGHFGFGRRICPGQYLAGTSLWLAISSMLTTLNITRARDNNGKEIIPDVELISGITSQPKLFPCLIAPRDELSESLLRQEQIWD